MRIYTLSKVGIDQMDAISKKAGLMLNGIVKEIYTTPITDDFDTVILDSIFHFYKNAIEKETKLLVRIAQV